MDDHAPHSVLLRGQLQTLGFVFVQDRVAGVPQHDFCKLVKPTAHAESTSSMAMQQKLCPQSQALELKSSQRAVHKYLQMQACACLAVGRSPRFADSREHCPNSTGSFFSPDRSERHTVLLLCVVVLITWSAAKAPVKVSASYQEVYSLGDTDGV